MRTRINITPARLQSRVCTSLQGIGLGNALKIAQVTLNVALLLSLCSAHSFRPSPAPVRIAPARFTFDPKQIPFRDQLKAFAEDWPGLQSKSGQKIKVALDRGLAEEEFRISLGSSASLRVGSPVAAAWALQALGELGTEHPGRTDVRGKPSYAFRCVTIDVARRFHSLSTLRQIVRWCHAGRVRFVQLHLTDDQNWMLPTQILAGVDRNNGSGHAAYTREEMRDLQTFAEARGVSIIPELDVPGHSSLLVKFNPAEFSLKGSASTNCVNFGSPAVRRTMRSLVREMAETFSKSPYIHIGGDEAWYPDAEKDPDVATAIEALNPKGSLQDVFVDFVSEMASTVLAAGKTPIVWEGFGPTLYARKRIPRQTLIIAWEGAYYPAKDLLKNGFRVVNAGWDPCYVVNHYPYDAYTLVPLPNLFNVDPKRFGIVNWAPGTSGSVELPAKSNVLGSMLCWWEGREWNAQSTLPLRILAFGNRFWSASARQDYASFLRRSRSAIKRIHDQTVPFGLTIEGVRPGNAKEFVERATIVAKSRDPSLTIAMRDDGGMPTPKDATSRLIINASSVISVQAYRGLKLVGETQFLDLKKVTVEDNLALHARATGSTPEDPQFPASLVTDGVSDNVGSFWLGYPIDCSLTIDLGKLKEFDRVDVVPFWAAGSSTQYTVALSSDGKLWSPLVDAKKQTEPPTSQGYVHHFATQSARYIRIQITGSQQFPPSMARIHEVRAYLEHP